MESMLILLGMLIATFLIISAAAEAILEVIRGFTDFLGRSLNMLLYKFWPEKTNLINISNKIAWPRSKVSLDQAIQMARDFDPGMDQMESKFQALEATVGQINTLSRKYKNELESLRDQVLNSTANISEENTPGHTANNDPDTDNEENTAASGRDTLSGEVNNNLASKPQALFGSYPKHEDSGKYDNWSKLSIAVKNDIDQYNRERIFFARLLAGIIGCLLVWQLDFSIFNFINDALGSEEGGRSFTEFQSKFLNIVAGGFAASVGSSYWHDQLKRVRHLKNAAKTVSVTNSR